MKIGLIDVDGHNFPNLPLMKLSAYHKSKGDDVEFVNPFFEYGKIYQSKVFDFTKDFNTCLQCDDIVKGGTGYNLENKLDYAVEHQYPDYSLYQEYKYATGFLTRGCPRDCDFCIVTQKEGRESKQVADLSEFWVDQKEIKLLDPNITACKDCNRLLQQLVDSKAWVDITQGIDIRCMTDEKANLLNQIKIKMLHFAWDNYEFKTYEKLKLFRDKLNYDARKLRVYVLTNFNTTHEQDLERIYKLKELEYHPYVMIYDKKNARKQTKQLARWTNNHFIWWSGKCETFEKYLTS